MFLYGFNIYGNSCMASDVLSEDDRKYKNIEVNYYNAPMLNRYENNEENIQHYYLPGKTIIYNRNGQLLEITKNAINFYSREDMTYEELEYIMFTSAFPYLLRFNDRIGLHGTAITFKGDAVIFIGRSGSWKSSLSYALVQKLKECVISDDLIAISDDGKNVFKGTQKIRLFKKNYLMINQIYNINANEDFYVVKTDDKLSINFLKGHLSSNEYNIRKIYILNNNRMREDNFEGTAIRIENKHKMFLELLPNMKCWQSIRGLDIAFELEKLQKLVQNDFVRSVSFNSINNKIEVNISEIVEAILNDIIGMENG